MKWEYLREEEFKGAIEKSGGLCVMTLGCLEKHGQHLPVGTDSLKGDKIVEFASDRTEVVMFPTTMWLGDVTCAHAYENPQADRLSGYIGINPQTLLTVLEELCDEIARNGFTKILICSSHGGNTGLLEYFTRSQFYKKKNYATMWTRAYSFAEIAPDKMLEAAKADPEYFSMLTEEDYKTLERFAETGSGGGHGDFRETALVYGTYPELVAPEKFDAECGVSTKRFAYPPEIDVKSTLIGWHVNFPNAFSGFAPIGCSKTIGDAAVKMSVDRLSKIFEYIKNDDQCVTAMEEINTL
jgi:creatinine amidohydrolase